MNFGFFKFLLSRHETEYTAANIRDNVHIVDAIDALEDRRIQDLASGVVIGAAATALVILLKAR